MRHWACSLRPLYIPRSMWSVLEHHHKQKYAPVILWCDGMRCDYELQACIGMLETKQGWKLVSLCLQQLLCLGETLCLFQMANSKGMPNSAFYRLKLAMLQWILDLHQSCEIEKYYFWFKMGNWGTDGHQVQSQGGKISDVGTQVFQ